MEIDSYEMGGQNWTDGFAEIFQKEKGYDIIPFLPAFAGRYVGSAEAVTGFVYDINVLYCELMTKNYFGYFTEMCNKNGLKSYVEPYGGGPVSTLDICGHIDLPMTEFWMSREQTHLPNTVSGAHIYGKNVISSESFTTRPELNWKMHPALTKASGDEAWTGGVNEFMFHRFVHQSNPHVEPGLTMGQWGSHIDRTQTWWMNAGKAWFEYLARGQYLLRQGYPVADVLIFMGDGPHKSALLRRRISPKIPTGINYDCSILNHIYDNQDVVIGSHHWNNPESPLISQMVQITKIEGDKVSIKDPLLHDVKPEWYCCFAEWEHIEEVGIENIAFEFPLYPDMPHHCEEGNNAVYLTSLMNGWVRNVRFLNADSGVLTDDISNVTIENVRTHGGKTAHYSVSMGEVRNVLIRNLKVENRVHHPLSFNTRASKCVFTDCEVETAPILDQHSGANQQNLFDNIKVYVDDPVHKTYKFGLFKTGGSSLWFPAHGAFSTFYNIDIIFANVPEKTDKPIELFGAKEGVSARLIGIHANHPVVIDYKPNAHKELINRKPAIPSLYEYQLNKRMKQQ